MVRDFIKVPRAGQPISVGQFKHLVDNAKAGVNVPGVMDGTGTYSKPPVRVSAWRPFFVPEDLVATVPAFGVLVQRSKGVRSHSPPVARADFYGRGTCPIFVNSGNEVRQGDYGEWTSPTIDPVQVAYDPRDGSPLSGEVWGPVPGSPLVRKGFPGFTVMVDPEINDQGWFWGLYDWSLCGVRVACAKDPIVPQSVSCARMPRWDETLNDGKGAYSLEPCFPVWVKETVLKFSANPGDCLVIHPIENDVAWELLDVIEGCEICRPVGEAAGFTTTVAPTANPNFPTTGMPACSGTCKYVWHASEGYWSKDSDGCSNTTTTAIPTTTTGSPGTSTTTTTTTPDPNTTTLSPCPCDPFTTTITPGDNPPDWPGAPTTTSTTPAPATSSTTPLPCKCAPPSFCGLNDGDCTWTYCTQADVKDGCNTTTTTTGGPTTTGSPTTTPAPCSLGCMWWAGWPGQSPGWHPVWSYCILNVCPCSYPSRNYVPCDYQWMPCVPTSTPPPPQDYCVGICRWAWASSPVNSWVLLTKGCVSNKYNCNCDAPSENGRVCWDIVETGCGWIGGGGGGGGGGSSTTGGPTTSTSTTVNPCNSFCVWKWDGSIWGQQTNPCTKNCPCCPPTYSGRADCEIARTGCSPFCSTTTVPPTTTKAPTTTVACSGNCDYICVPNDLGGYYWKLVQSCYTGGNKNCVCGKFCQQMPCNADYVGYHQFIGCVDKTGPTTSCPTTTLPPPTTTTTSTTAAPPTTPSPNCSGCSTWRFHLWGSNNHYWELITSDCKQVNTNWDPEHLSPCALPFVCTPGTPYGDDLQDGGIYTSCDCYCGYGLPPYPQ